jgi:CO dehydrogenase maturation factor
MKLAITGKGGTGKTTLSVLLARSFAEDGKKVILVDADPATNLATTLGIPNPEEITPISEMRELIEERMEVNYDSPAAMYKLNPKVDDLPEKYWVEKDGIKLLVMGTIQEGGSGCACPQNSFLKALLMNLFFARDEIVILDMEAGIEHIGRGTASAVDVFIVMLEASRQSMETGQKIVKLAQQIGIKTIMAVGSKIRNDQQQKFIQDNANFVRLAGFLPYSEELLFSTMEGSGQIKPPDNMIDEVDKLRKALESS